MGCVEEAGDWLDLDLRNFWWDEGRQRNSESSESNSIQWFEITKEAMQLQFWSINCIDIETDLNSAH